MKGDGGMYGIANPIGLFLPFSIFSDAFDARYPNEKGFEYLLRKTGLFLNPMLQGAGVSLGLMRRYPDFLGTYSIRQVYRKVRDWNRNNGNILGLDDPGITGDPIQDISNSMWDKINALLREVDEDIEDTELPNLNQPKQDVVADLIVEQAEEDFGVSYMDMTQDQKEEVDAAIWAVRNGETDNDRANEALATASPWWEAPANVITPGGFRAKSESGDQRKKDERAYWSTVMADGTPTKEQENAHQRTEATMAGSPESSSLAIGQQELDRIGTPHQRSLAKGWATIAYDPLPSDSYQEIGGRTYYGSEVNAMSQDERMKLADAWVLDNSDAIIDENPDDGITPPSELQQYRDQRDAVIAESPELTSYDTYKDRARDFDGGVRGFREYLEETSPEFGQEIGRERQRLQAQGISGKELETRLDKWTTSDSGYFAYTGVRDRSNDAEPLDTYDPSKAPPPLTAEEQARLISESAGDGSGGSGWNGELNMPQYQVEIMNEVNAYREAVAGFEAQYGPIENYSTRQGQMAVEQWMAENGVEMTSDVKSYLEWAEEQRAAGLDDSLEAYFASLNAEYEARKAATAE